MSDFRLRDLLWPLLVIAMAVVWWIDRAVLSHRIERSAAENLECRQNLTKSHRFIRRLTAKLGELDANWEAEVIMPADDN
jgi:hypothetical protein